VHLQNKMYLLQNLFPKLAAETDHDPCLLGPHSEIVADEAERLALSGLIRAGPVNLELTSDGKKAADILKKRSSREEIQKIEEFE